MNIVSSRNPVQLSVRLGRAILPVCVLAACTEPNHLGNPLTLPFTALTNAAENSVYERERAAVKARIVRDEGAMRAEGFAGPVTESILMTLPAESREQARRDFLEAARYPDFTERATVVMMVLRD